MLKGMFKKTTYINITSDVKKEAAKVPAGSENVEVPEGLWTKCPKCGHALYTKELKDKLFVCSHCSHNLRVGANDRLQMILDEGSFTPWDEAVETGNPLDFPATLKKSRVPGSRPGCGRRLFLAADVLMDKRRPLLSWMPLFLWRAWERLSERKLPA